MTLVMALGCTNGVIIAADSASTDAESGIKQPAIKVRRLGEEPILYGGSGDVGLLQKIGNALTEYRPQTKIFNTSKELRKLIAPIQRDACDLHVRYPVQGFHEPPPAILLFVGIHQQKPWILEIERNNGDTFYSDPQFGYFTAIGSGKALAQAVIRPYLYEHESRDLDIGKILSWRVMDDAIELSASGLAAPIHMYVIQSDGTVEKLDDQELDRLRTFCELWRSRQRETLGSLLFPAHSEQTAEIPTVEIQEAN